MGPKDCPSSPWERSAMDYLTFGKAITLATDWVWQNMPVIPATQKAEAGGSQV